VTNSLIRVLVVDDAPAVRRALERVLGRAGFEVSAAGSGEEAVDLLAAKEVDVVLLDLQMPGMSGKSAYHTIVSRWPQLTHQIAIMSGDTVSEEAVAWIRAVDVPVLSKPFETAVLVELVQQLSRRDPRRTAMGE
jgi:DNA-binding response OmpR family regulator